MQSLARNGYSDAQVKAALHAPSRTWDFAYELLDRRNQHKLWLDQVSEGAVKQSAIEEVRRSAFFRMRDTDKIHWPSDRIRPWVKLRMADGGWVSWPQGVFLLTSPTRQITGSGTAYRDVEGLDQTILLRDYSTSSRYAVLKGTNYAAAIRELLVDAGVANINVEPTALVTSSDRDWDPGVSRLDILNDLLDAINYMPLYFNSDGVAVCRAYLLPDQRPSEYVYADDAASVTNVAMTETMDLESTPNQWTLVVSEPDRVLVSQWTNDNPLSLTSVTSRGRVISVFDDSVDAANQTTLDALVQRRAYEDSQEPLEVEFSTGLMPFHDNEDMVTLNLSRLGTQAKYRETMWNLPMMPGQTMEHRVERVVNVDPTNVVAQDPVNP